MERLDGPYSQSGSGNDYGKDLFTTIDKSGCSKYFNYTKEWFGMATCCSLIKSKLTDQGWKRVAGNLECS